MKKLALLTALAATLAAPSIAMAANAKHPYQNVNHKNDAGNTTGDEATAKLNQQQLDQIKAGMAK
jgi:opacity protein-like surface antigen